MGRRRRLSEPLDEGLRAVLHARWELCLLGGYAYRRRDTPAGRALARLKAAHTARQMPAVDAYRAALAVLEAQGAAADFEAWRTGRRDICASHWPTTDDRDLRAV